MSLESKKRKKGNEREIQNIQSANIKANIKEDKKLLKPASNYFVSLLLCLED